jgi:DNA-directed RNA polymerase alpha subunit
VIEIMNKIDGVDLHEKRGGRFQFYINLTRSMKETPIETLDLSVRAYHSLKRAELHTIGDIADAFAAGRDLKGIRNCGAKSIREIMEHLFLHQYNMLSPGGKEHYLAEVIRLNAEAQAIEREQQKEKTVRQRL